MKKSTRIVKKLLALFLVVLMSINTFSAVVGDNDGAAFITKAEFDSLKNDFQSQLDTYNSSIDNKIDGAIAAYLAGVRISKIEKVESLYDDSWRWTSKTDYSYDTVSQKKFYFKCDFYTRTSVGAGAYYSHWTIEPIEKSSRTYTTLIDDNGILRYKSLVFRWEAIIYFGRIGDQAYSGGTCGNIQWNSFWPTSSYEKITSQRERAAVTSSTGGYWYDGHNTLYVDQTDLTWDPIIAPCSTATTYYYKANELLQSSTDQGSAVTVVKADVNASSDLDSSWPRSRFDSLSYYPNQLVHSDSNKNITTNELVLYDLKQKTTFNDKLKYGVCIGTTNAQLNPDAKIKVKLSTSVTGTIDIRVGTTAVNAWNSSTAIASATETISSPNTDTEIVITPTSASLSTSLLYMIFKPATTSALGTVSIKEINIETT